MKRRLSGTGLVILSMFALSAGTVRAQTGAMFGEIIGKAVDEQGSVLPGVTVTLSGPAIMGQQVTTTNERGLYRFPAVPSGTHRLEFELAGFSNYVREAIVVPIRTTITIDVTLRVATLQENVTVHGQSPVVDSENAKLGDRLSSEVLAAIPSQRSLFGTATLAPGMVMSTQDVGGVRSHTLSKMVAHGAVMPNMNYFGVIADSPTGDGMMQYVDINSIEELSVDTAAMGADVEGGGGPNINVLPKSGGNNLTGSVYFIGLNDRLVDHNIDDRLRAQGITTGSTTLRLYDVNADAGGPIKKDRLWWYFSFRNYDNYERVDGFPKDFSSNLRNYTAHVNWKVSQANNLSFYYTPNHKRQPNRGAAFNVSPEATRNQTSERHLENINLTSVVNQRTFLDISVTHSHMPVDYDYAREWYALDDKIPASFDITRGTSWGAFSAGHQIDDGRRFHAAAALTYYRDGLLGGNHQLKGGAETGHGWGRDVRTAYGDTQFRYRNGVPAEIFAFNTPKISKETLRSFAGYVHDRIAYSRYTVNLGVRYEFTDAWLPEQTGGGGRWVPQTVFPRKDAGFNWSHFAPRTGLVLRLTEDGRNVAKASYGRYFERLYTPYFNLINPNVFSTTGIATYQWFGDLNSNGTVEAGEYSPNPLRVFVPRLNSIDSGFKAPKTDEITAAYQRELRDNLGLSVSWVQRWFTDNFADVNVGIPPEAYAPVTLNDSGPDNLANTSDDRPITMYNVLPAFLGRDAFRRQTMPGTMTYRGLEFALTKRLSNRWQLAGSYVWSRSEGVILVYSSANGASRNMADPTNPNTALFSNGSDANEQPHAFKLIGSYQAGYKINVGWNLQLLSGLPIDRTFQASLAQGATTVRAERRGTFRQDSPKLLSLKIDKEFPLWKNLRASGIAELHNVLNTNSAQAYATLTREFRSPAELEAAKATGGTYFGRISQIMPPRMLKLGVRLDF